MPVNDWLMEGDAAIRWQALRDLQGAGEKAYEAERASVSRTGWGARLLALQRDDGTWTANTYTPKWTSTFYTMQLLWQLGVEPGEPRSLRGARVLLDRGAAKDGGLRYTGATAPAATGETCISGMGLAILSWFLQGERRLELLVEHLLGEQMPDGGWNCQYRTRPATHASFNTTILALEGLLEWERRNGPSAHVSAARQRGHEFLFAHRLFRSHTTGAVVKKQFTLFAFPPRWHYDILRALDYLAAAGAPRDSRAEEALEMVRARRRPDGTWPPAYRHAGSTYFELEERARASRWNTLRALRVLRWWEGDG
jgi:hypothetical protein